MVELVNITAGGDLGNQLRLNELAIDINAHSVEYDPDIYPGIFVQFRKDGPKSTLYRTGKYVITGADDEEEIDQESMEIFNALIDIGINVDREEPTIYNMVFSGDLNYEINLSELAIFLGLDKTEYEPEQSPFLVYKPNKSNCTITISRTGKIVITGLTNKQDAETVFNDLKQELEMIFD